MANSPAIECRRLSKRFGAFVAVDSLSFEVPHGRIFGFLGPNGSGKSTTIRMLCGVLTPSDGVGLVSGIDVAQDPEGVRKHIGYMSQKFSLYEDLTVWENLRFFGGIYGLWGGRRRARIREVLQMIDMTGQENQFVGALSVGVRQRLALGAALLHRPPILFLDEPTSGVDPVSRRHFWELIYDLTAQGTTVLVTTHYMDEAEHCHQILLIRDGRLVAQGSPQELKTTLLKGTLLAIECDRPFEAVDRIAPLPGVYEAALYGALLHVSVADAAQGEAAVRAELARQGIRIVSLEPVEPTLEDAFVAVAQEAA